MENKKIITLFALTGLTLTILIAIVIYYLSLPSLSVKKGDENIVFIMNDKYYTTPTKINNLKPGDYRLVTHVSDYEDLTTEFKLRPFEHKNIELKLKKLPVSDAVLKEERQWTDYFNESSAKSEAEVEKRYQNNTLTQYLPYFSDTFLIDYYLDDNNKVVYIIRSNNYLEDIKKAKEWISSKNINPDTIYLSNN
jgi:hypothetical protein